MTVPSFSAGAGGKSNPGEKRRVLEGAGGGKKGNRDEVPDDVVQVPGFDTTIAN